MKTIIRNPLRQVVRTSILEEGKAKEVKIKSKAFIEIDADQFTPILEKQISSGKLKIRQPKAQPDNRNPVVIEEFTPPNGSLD